jgi:hypothetical protein
MSMPEAAVDEYNNAVPGKHYIWTTRQVGSMEPESEP